MGLLTIDEAAAHLGTTPRFVRRLVAERRIAYSKLGKFVRIASTDLDEFIAAGRVQPDSGGARSPFVRPTGPRPRH